MDEKKGLPKATGHQEKPPKTPLSAKTSAPDPNTSQKVKTAADEKSRSEKEPGPAQKKIKAGANLGKDIFEEISSQFDQLFPEEPKGQPAQKPSGKIAGKKEPGPAPASKDAPRARQPAETDPLKAAEEKISSSQKEIKADSDPAKESFDELSRQLDQLFPEEEKAKLRQEPSAKTAENQPSRPEPAVKDVRKAEKTTQTGAIKPAKKEPIFQSVFNEEQDGKPSPKAPQKPVRASQEQKPDKLAAEADAQPGKAAEREASIPPKDSEPKPKGTQDIRKQVRKPTPAVQEPSRAAKGKGEKKEFVIPYSKDKSKKEPLPKAPLPPKKRKTEKITAGKDTPAGKAPKKVVPLETKDSRPKPQMAPPTKKKVEKAPLPVRETPEGRKPARADKKKAGQRIDRKRLSEKIGVKAARKKSSYRNYVLLGTLVVLGAVIAFSPFGPVQLFKKEEAPQKLTTQKIAKAPLRPQEKKPVPATKKPLGPASGSVKIKKSVPPPPKAQGKKPVPVKKNPVVQASRSVEIKARTPSPKKVSPKSPPPISQKKLERPQEIKTFLMKWKAAWENTAGASGDMETYMSFYSEDFSAMGLDKSGWKQDKARKNKAKEWIRIGIKNINIIGNPENKRVEVNFLQDYRSSNYAGISGKTLELKKEKSGWKIVGIKTATRSYPHLASYPYSIYGGSYRSIRAAQSTIRDHQLKGLQTFWVRIDLGPKGVWYRIFSGCYKDLEAARKIIKDKQLKEGQPERIQYANYIGTYLSEQNLRKPDQLLSKYGYAPYYIKDDQGKFHLFVGAFYKAKNARKLFNELSSRGIPSQVVQR